MNYNLIQMPARDLDRKAPQETSTNVQLSQREIFQQKMDAAESVYLDALDLARPDFERDIEIASGNHEVEIDEIVRGFYNQPFDDQPFSSMPPVAWGKSYSPEKLAKFDDEKAAINLKYRLAISDARKKYEQNRKEAKKKFDQEYQAIWSEYGHESGSPVPDIPHIAVVEQPSQSPQQANDHYEYQAA